MTVFAVLLGFLFTSLSTSSPDVLQFCNASLFAFTTCCTCWCHQHVSFQPILPILFLQFRLCISLPLRKYRHHSCFRSSLLPGLWTFNSNSSLFRFHHLILFSFKSFNSLFSWVFQSTFIRSSDGDVLKLFHLVSLYSLLRTRIKAIIDCRYKRSLTVVSYCGILSVHRFKYSFKTSNSCTFAISCTCSPL